MVASADVLSTKPRLSKRARLSATISLVKDLGWKPVTPATWHTETAELLIERDALPPVLTSPVVVGRERSLALFDAAYDEHARRLANALAGER